MTSTRNAQKGDPPLYEGNAPFSQAWYLLQCKSKQDSVAEEHLGRQGFVCYRPEITDEVKGRPLRKSLFPGYLFILLNTQQNWGPIRSTRGVQKFVQFGSEPTCVPGNIIELIKGRLSTAKQPSSNAWSRENYTVYLEEIFKETDSEKRAYLLIKLIENTM